MKKFQVMKVLFEKICLIIESLTRLISSCMRCFFVSRVDPSGFNFRVHRSLYSTSKFGFRCNVAGSTGGSMSAKQMSSQ